MSLLGIGVKLSQVVLTVLAQLFISCKFYALKSFFFQELQDNRMKSGTDVIKHENYIDTGFFCDLFYVNAWQTWITIFTYIRIIFRFSCENEFAWTLCFPHFPVKYLLWNSICSVWCIRTIVTKLTPAPHPTLL